MRIFQPTAIKLLIAQCIAHLAIIPMVIYGTWWQWLIVGCMLFVDGCLGLTMTQHRLLSHRSWKCPKILEYFLTLCATINLSGSALAWVSLHRQHHQHCDTKLDPHSPLYKGWPYTLWFNMFSKFDMRYVRDLARNKFYQWEHKYYFVIIMSFVLFLYLISPFAVVYAFLVPAALCWHCTGGINTFNHWGGKINNNLILAVIHWGEGYHKNHHDNPNSSRFGKIDIGATVIEFIEKFQK